MLINGKTNLFYVEFEMHYQHHISFKVEFLIKSRTDNNPFKTKKFCKELKDYLLLDQIKEESQG